jgi:hypothetical protein
VAVVEGVVVGRVAGGGREESVRDFESVGSLTVGAAEELVEDGTDMGGGDGS